MTTAIAAPLRRRLAKIDPSAWEHPSDRAALETLRHVVGFDVALRKFIGLVGERAVALMFKGNAVQVGPKQLPRLHQRLLEVQDTLDVREEIPLFVTQRPYFNAGAYGVDTPFIVLNSATLDLLDGDEQRALLGHEVGHIASGHSLYRTMLALILMAGFRQLPFLAGMAVLPIRVALQEWSRKSELSADRAALLATQDLKAVARLHMIAAGGSLTTRDELNVESFLEQAHQYDAASGLDSVFKLLNLVDMSHPLNTVRAAEIARWSHTRQYRQILEGAYRTRDENATRHRLASDLQDGAAFYAREARDAVVGAAEDARKTVKQVASVARQAAQRVSDMMDREDTE